MRVVFAGTPPFAAAALEAIAAAGHVVSLVLTQPDRPAGRGMRVSESAVARSAANLGVPLWKPASLRGPEAPARLGEESADVMVVAAYGLLLPVAVLEVPRRGCLNIHASLLPRWRGAAPIQRAIMAGDATTGISIMRMDAGLDTGPVLLAREHPIGARDTAGTLTEALARLGAESIVEALRDLDSLAPRAQDASAATYAAKLGKHEARIRWDQPSESIDRQVRALDPAPGAETTYGAEVLKVWKATSVKDSGAPGQVLESRGKRLVVACGKGALAIEEMQRPGGRRMAASDFLAGARLAVGTVLGSAVAPVQPPS